MARLVEHFNKRLGQLDTERSTFINLYRELSDNILGYRGRFLVTDRNKGHKRNTRQYNNTAKRAVRTLQAGLMAGATPKSTPWFKLQTLDRSLREFGPVKQWIELVEKLMREIFAASNFYNTLSQLYGDIGTFGTSPMAIYQDFQNVIRCQSFPVGSYMLGANGHGDIDTMYREYQLTVGQLVSQFGLNNCSISTQNNWANGTTEAWADLVHAVEPNDDRDGQSPLAENMLFRSVYYEKSAPRDATKFLRRSGFEEFPIMAPRWDVTAEDVYATDCPGMMAIGDTKALQVEEVKKAKAIDKHVDPPLQAPSSMKGKRVSLIAGDISYIDQAQPGQGISPIYAINPQIRELREDIQANEERINASYFVDLFLMFANVENRERVTAEEIARKHEEKLLMLGPMSERLHTELLDKAVERTFNIAARANILPEVPPEVAGQALEVEYISTLASAQKVVATSGIERTAAFVGSLAEFDPQIVDKLDTDQAVDEYAHALSVPVQVVRPDEDVEMIREARAQAQRAQQMAQAAEAAVPATQAAKNLAETDTEGKNALTDANQAVQALTQ